MSINPSWAAGRKFTSRLLCRLLSREREELQTFGLYD
jgi:hypothetical protein